MKIKHKSFLYFSADILIFHTNTLTDYSVCRRRRLHFKDLGSCLFRLITSCHLSRVRPTLLLARGHSVSLAWVVVHHPSFGSHFFSAVYTVKFCSLESIYNKYCRISSFLSLPNQVQPLTFHRNFISVTRILDLSL